jgi:hypothetical protein
VTIETSVTLSPRGVPFPWPAVAGVVSAAQCVFLDWEPGPARRRHHLVYGAITDADATGGGSPGPVPR